MLVARQGSSALILKCCRVVIDRPRALTTQRNRTADEPQRETPRASAAATAGTTVDEHDVANFERLSAGASTSNNEWADENGAFKALHSFNRLRVPWIVEELTKPQQRVSGQPLEGLRVVDVGAGGGILSLALCRLGAQVVGVDASAGAVRAAEANSRGALRPAQRASIRFVHSSVERFAEGSPEAFDGVVASEVLEHVADLEGSIRACVRLAKPGATLFFTTINQTWLSRLLAVWLAEEVLSLVPRGMHEWEKFVPPETLRRHLMAEGCRVKRTHGALYNPLANAWSWSTLDHVNYALSAKKC